MIRTLLLLGRVMLTAVLPCRQREAVAVEVVGPGLGRTIGPVQVRRLGDHRLAGEAGRVEPVAHGLGVGLRRAVAEGDGERQVELGTEDAASQEGQRAVGAARQGDREAGLADHVRAVRGAGRAEVAVDVTRGPELQAHAIEEDDPGQRLGGEGVGAAQPAGVGPAVADDAGDIEVGRQVHGRTERGGGVVAAE